MAFDGKYTFCAITAASLISYFTTCYFSTKSKKKNYNFLELANPGGSAKDRPALAIIRYFEETGQLVPGRGDVVFEGTSGSTGISFAMLCNSMGYTCHICLPDDTSHEKLALLESYGAIIEKVKPASIVDPDQYVNAARKRAFEKCQDDTPGMGVFADQFENDCNWRAHYAGTGPEIWEQMNGKIDAFVSGSGTGGTISGCTRYFKDQGANTQIILADPQGSGLYNRVKYGVMYDHVEKEGTRRRHQVDTIVEGIGLNRVTHNFIQAEEFIDDAVRVSDLEAIKMARWLSDNEGMFVGSSSCIGAIGAVKAALKYKKDDETNGIVRDKTNRKRIVFIACDSGNRHLSKFWKQARFIDRGVQLKDILEN
ncbi:putative cysteine synthase [Martiniozyma asiatica (nom. inval.)]|nr:putative cysteine synthase [Martiniozyma asiatica]